MKHKLAALGIIVLAMVAIATSLAEAQTGDWTYACGENGTVKVTGMTEVRYGADGACGYRYATVSSNIPCSNAYFGDPCVGTLKHCDTRPAGALPSGEETSMRIFVWVDGITGPSTDTWHRGWIDATGVTFSMTSSVSISGTGGGGDKSTLDGVIIVKEIDTSSAKLAVYCARGEHLRSVQIHFVEKSTPKIAFYEILMTDAAISSVSMDTNSSQSSLKEAYKFIARRVQWTATPIKDDGSAGPSQSACWDFTANKECPIVR